jgi:hypothetical protein
VKAIFIAIQLTCSACGYHLGRGPSAETVLSIGEIHVNSADSDVEETLVRAFAEALSRHATLGNGTSVDLGLKRYTVMPIGPGGRQFQIEIEIELQAENGQAGHAKGKRVFLGSGDGQAQRRAKESAVRELSGHVVELALMDLLQMDSKE